MNKIAFLLVLLVMSSVAVADSEYCLAQYKSDFSFANSEYVTDMPNGLTAQVRWGPHGYVGAILQPRVGDGDRVPVEIFETFYRALNCQWNSIYPVWESTAQTFSERKDCIALVYGSGEATFQCGHLLESSWLDEDVLGPFKTYQSRATGPWYQSAEYTAAKEELDRLAGQALGDIHKAIINAVSTLECHSGVDTQLIEIPENDRFLPTNLPSSIEASITFTVGTNGAVSEILLGQKADYQFEYVMAAAARYHEFPEREEKCRAAWNHVFE